MTHDYQTLISKLHQQRDALSAEEYQFVVETLRFKVFDRDYLDDIESDLITQLPELIDEPKLSVHYISPEFLSYLRQYPKNIDDFYFLLRDYLSLKIDNLEAFSPDEQFILNYIPEIDDCYALTVPITEELIALGANFPERLSSEQWHCLSTYLDAKVIDKQALTQEEKIVADHLYRMSTDEGLDIEYNDTTLRDDILDPDVSSLEYGYDIYDFSQLIQRLESANYDRRFYRIYEDIPELERPLNIREIRVIKHAWGFDPNNEEERLNVLRPYWAAQDVLDPDGSHERYVAKMQRFRR